MLLSFSVSMVKMVAHEPLDCSGTVFLLQMNQRVQPATLITRRVALIHLKATICCECTSFNPRAPRTIVRHQPDVPLNRQVHRTRRWWRSDGSGRRKRRRLDSEEKCSRKVRKEQNNNNKAAAIQKELNLTDGEIHKHSHPIRKTYRARHKPNVMMKGNQLKQQASQTIARSAVRKRDLYTIKCNETEMEFSFFFATRLIDTDWRWNDWQRQ